MVTVRKVLLTIVTVILSPGSNLKKINDENQHANRRANQSAALAALLVLLIAVTAQAYAEPYVDRDTNNVELFSLIASAVVLMIGTHHLLDAMPIGWSPVRC